MKVFQRIAWGMELFLCLILEPFEGVLEPLA